MKFMVRCIEVSRNGHTSQWSALLEKDKDEGKLDQVGGTAQFRVSYVKPELFIPNEVYEVTIEKKP